MIEDLERAGVVATRLMGRQREVFLNPDYVAAKELEALLQRLILCEKRYQETLASAARRRPRRAGKIL
jgi:hypothetical protein